MAVALPGRGILGVRGHAPATTRQGCGNAERGAHGNYVGHETSLQGGMAQTIELLVMDALNVDAKLD